MDVGPRAPADKPADEPPAASSRVRLAIVVALLVLAPIVARVSGLSTHITMAHLRELVSQAGALGALAFVAVFVGAVVAQVPGIAFVVVAPTMFPLPEAWLLCFFASNLAVILNFAVVRKAAGRPLAELENRYLRRLLSQLDRHPVRTVALLRTLTVMFPPVTGALALTRISARDHALGSAIGMLLPVSALLYAASAILAFFP